MRIGIDATAWTNWRGFGRFTRSLVHAVLRIDREHEYVLFFDGPIEEDVPLPGSARRVIVPTSRRLTDAVSINSRRGLRDIARMTQAVAREPLDLFFSPSIDGYFPLLTRARILVTIHDAVPELFPAETLPRWQSRWMRRLKVATAIRQADRIVTGSEYARRKISGALEIQPDRIAIVPYGADAVFQSHTPADVAGRDASARFGIPGPYLLHVGGSGPNKNLDALVQAFAQLTMPPGEKAPYLVLAGNHDDDTVYPESRRLTRTIVEHGLESRVRMLGFCSDEDLAMLYRGAQAVAVVSLMEGFGLPALEAVASGTPVIATRESPLPEALGDAALVVDPRSVEQIAAAVRTIFLEPERLAELRAAAHARRDMFRWDRSARALLTVFDTFLARVPPFP